MAEPESPQDKRDDPAAHPAGVRRAVPRPHSPPSQSLLSRLTDRSPLVGRSDELDFLKAQFEAVATGGGGRLIFLRGEPGVGKTRLARELGLYATHCGAIFLEGHYLRDGSAAYGPWVEALRTGLRDLTREELAQVVEPFGSDLVQLIPELAQQLEPRLLSPPLPPEEQRRRLYEGIAELVINLSQRAPLVLMIDDLQWAPDITLLVHLARRLAQSRALVLGAYREQEFQEQPGLMREWADLNRARLMTPLSLSPFDADETGQLVAHYFGAEAAHQLHDAVYRRTHGNAFFVEEVLRSLTDTGAVRATEVGWEVADPSRLSIPASMKLAVEERVARLGGAVHEILVQAAVLGQEFSFPALQALTGRSEEDLLEVIERA